MTDKNKPLHKQIEEDLLHKITSGAYKEGELIPKEIDLIEQYGVSRPTVRQAIQTLVANGYLERVKRKGTFVKKPKINQEFTHVIESFDTEISRKGLKPFTKLLLFDTVIPPLQVAEKLEISEDENVYKLVRLRYAEKDPIVLVTSYIPKKYFPHFENYDFSKKLLYTAFSESGYSIASITRRLETMKCDETTSDLLAINENDPIFYFRSVGYTEHHIPIEYSVAKYRGDLNSFVFELKINS